MRGGSDSLGDFLRDHQNWFLYLLTEILIRGEQKTYSLSPYYRTVPCYLIICRQKEVKLTVLF